MIDLIFNILFVIVSLYIFIKTIFYAIYEIKAENNKIGRNWCYCIFYAYYYFF